MELFRKEGPVEFSNIYAGVAEGEWERTRSPEISGVIAGNALS